MLKRIKKQLLQLEEQNLKRNIIHKNANSNHTKITINNKDYIDFTSNDYLGLSNHPEVINAAQNTLQKYGVSASSSSWVSGLTDIHLELKETIATWLQQPKATLFSCGFMANIGCIQALCSRKDIVFHDKNNHASLIEAVKLTNCKHYRYHHLDHAHLKKLLNQHHQQYNWVITDAVFSMSGKIAPLQKIQQLSKLNSAHLIIDDAHGIGVLGKNGSGTLNALNIESSANNLHIITFGKAIGTMGAAVAGDANTIEMIEQSAKAIAFTTAMPPCIAASSLASINLIKNNPAIRKKLINNLQYFKLLAKQENLAIDIDKTPIIKLNSQSIEQSIEWSKILQQHQIWAHPVRPPSVIWPGLRIIINAKHTKSELEQLLFALSTLEIKE